MQPFSSALRRCYAARMPRVARTVFAGVAHHLRQGGNRPENVFFTDEDRRAYLIGLKEVCKKHGVEIPAYSSFINKNCSPGTSYAQRRWLVELIFPPFGGLM
jgi:putative transposase